MDTLDLSILNFLQRDGRTPYTEIAAAVGVSEGTVRQRVGRMLADGRLQIVGLIDPNRAGYDAPALIGVSVEGAEVESAAAAIAAYPEVSYLVMVSGEYDLIVEVVCRDREHLAEFLNQRLRRTPGVSRTRSFVILRTFKMAYGAHADQDTDEHGKPGLLPK